ncbi:hypothetical protein TIFTF001_001466 [Ficus carica]|uniref:Uncharacterized protein n=1 Tax=Ficus carica TaxID=3494 RepID=A0AA88CM34_FICCA|nr:hypothetical protein TIFTF001_001466 [Ficus carica]
MLKSCEDQIRSDPGVNEESLGEDSMKKWLDFAFSSGNSNNLQQLVILGTFMRYPGFALHLRASNSLTTPHCIWLNENTKFRSLQNLSLTDTLLTSDIINKTFLSGSPLLKSLSLVTCQGPPSLEVSGLVWITSIEMG